MRTIAALSGTLTQLDPAPRAATATPRAAWSSTLARREPLLFALLILLQLIPVWAFTYLPTTDGAAHVANAQIMRRIADPHLDVFRQYYYVNSAPIPNLVGHLVLAGLLSVLKPVLAEKALVTLYMTLFPLAVRYAVRAIRPKAVPLAFLAFPMVYNYLFAQGFYNFNLSIAVFFFVVGYWIRNRDRLNAWRAILLTAMVLLLYTSHLYSLMMACGVMAALTAWFSWPQVQSRDWRPVARRAGITLLAVLPALVLAIAYRPAQPPPDPRAPEAWSFKEDLVGLLQFSSMVSYRTKEAWLGAAVVALFGALTLMALVGKIARGSWTRWDALLVLPAGLVVVYFTAHDRVYLHFYIPQRVMLYVFLTLILWLAGQPMTRRVRWAAVPAAALLSLAFLASHAQKYREFAPQLAEFVAAGDHIEPNSTFLPLIFSTRGRTAAGQVSSVDVQPFYMASGYIAARRDAVDLKNYEANTDHFPVRFHPDKNPYTHLAVGDGFNTVPPVIDIKAFEHAGGRVDYVLISGLQKDFRADPRTQAIFTQLQKDYDPIPLDKAFQTELWKRR